MSIALLVATTAGAQQKSQSVIVSAARQSLEKHFGANFNAYEKLKVVDNISQLSVVASADGGTAFVNRQTGTVMGCSPSAYTSEDELPCGLKLWLEAANYAIKNNSLSATKTGDYTISEKVNSFITTTWNQASPFNKYCPKNSLNATCLTGCVATAMAQVMNLYEYPAKGTGTGCYSIDNGNSYTSVNISGTYDWTNMKDSYNGTYSNNQANAVATLMRDCGYAVNMVYSTSASSSSDSDIPHAMAYNFSYDSLAVNYIIKKYATDTEWYSTIYNELTAKRPVIYSGASETDGGHCFVLDGVDTNGDVHVNWGWGGYQDGYFDMDVFQEGFDFITDQSIVYGFNPEPTAANATPSYQSRIVVEDPSLTASSTNLYLTCGIFNFDWREFVGDLYLKIANTANSSKTYKIWLTSAQYPTPIQFLWGSRFTNENLNSYFSKGASTMKFPAGTYEVSFVCKGKYDSAEKLAITEGGKEWKAKFTANTQGIITIDESSGISSLTVDPAVDNSKVYDLNGNRVSSGYKGLKIIKGKKYFEK